MLAGVQPSALPALLATSSSALWLTPAGEVEALSHPAARLRAMAARPLVCHAALTSRRLGAESFPVLDLLELFAFVRPARFAVPTPRGLAEALGLALPRTLEEELRTLPEAAAALLRECAATGAGDRDTGRIAAQMARAGWPWAGAVVAALGHGGAGAGGLDVWARLPEWNEQAPPPPPGQAAVSPAEARSRLALLLGPDAETRPEQADYASATAAAFQPRAVPGEPWVVLAEAGTGIGKTLGYIAPASLWAEANQGSVWISTYTKNLQRQVDQELDRLYPDRDEKERRVVVRKGRENYLCLLNLEEGVAALAHRPQDTIAFGLLARWAAASRDGDLVGGDFPAWLVDILGRGRTLELTDRRGECIYAACPHYRKCFIERSQRRARRAEIVVANHALVMITAANQAALGGEGLLPTRYVFDEGHRLFDAADSAFSACLGGLEAAELRRWLIGTEDGVRGRARGLKRRVLDLIAEDPAAVTAIEAALQAAAALPGQGWLRRVQGGAPHGPAERFLAGVRQLVLARGVKDQGGYDLEAPTVPPDPAVGEVARALDAALHRLQEPCETLMRRLIALLDSEAGTLESAERQRIEAVCRGLIRRGRDQLGAWRRMLQSLVATPPDEVIDWFEIARSDGREIDIAFRRHLIDPTTPFIALLAAHAHGAVITSATLRDGTGDAEHDWSVAESETGTRHLPRPAMRAAFASPFDYPALTRVLVVTDLNAADARLRAAAYRELFLAAGGGALGLFTAIGRLRAVQAHLAPALDAAGLTLLAQHVDALDTGTLVDIFRAESDACLLGTDAVRDGVDVPGDALRLIVFDRVPWPRPSLAHKARRQVFGRNAYDDRLTRLRLKQAFGRLVRRADDRGVFVLLDSRLPSRLLGAFPEGVAVERIPLAQAVGRLRAFFGRSA
ncbi:MAG: ATP-dependent DNA helicase [Alphaproteobacteria bacterium]|nr:ATP-dependent DNA helicase [Alphaproteobacteria bacterium]